MGHRLSKIFTRTGDQGDTALGDGSRVSKDHVLVEAFGCCDELNSRIGLLLVEDLPENIRQTLNRLQHELFDLGSELCVPGHEKLSEVHVTRLEEEIEHYNAALPYLKEFILPGGNRPAALAHLCRTQCRQLERVMVNTQRQHDLSPVSLKYVNRLSDWFFVIARVLARQDGGQEVLWQPNPNNDGIS